MRQGSPIEEALREELRRKDEALQRAQDQLDMLANTVLGGVARLDVDDGLRILTASDGYYRLSGYTREEALGPPMCGRGVNLVLPADRPKVQAAVDHTVRYGGPFSVTYRLRRKNGSVAWSTAHCTGMVQSGSQRVLEVFFMDATEANLAEFQLKSLLNNMPGGVLQTEVGQEVRLLYANDEAYRQLDMTPGECSCEAFQARYLQAVHPGDRQLLIDRVQSLKADRIMRTALYFRVFTKTGEIRWLRAKASHLKGGLDGMRIVQAVLTDVTEERRQRQQDAIQEERYRIISEQTRDTVFEWNLMDDSIQFSSAYERMFGFRPPEEIRISNLLDHDIIYEDDKPAVARMIRAVRAGQPYVEAEYRAKHKDGSYLWCCNRVTTIYDDRHIPVRAVGLLTDIDTYKSTAETFKSLAMQDPLTGLLNRRSMQQAVERRLFKGGVHSLHAYLQFDIDHFKQVNDTMGHDAGDQVLGHISRQLMGQFQDGDLAGRMGGDEFAVFLGDIVTRESARIAAERLRAAMDIEFSYGEHHFPISISVGIAYSPDQGRDFQSLYQSADAALYISKRKGGNQVSWR